MTCVATKGPQPYALRAPAMLTRLIRRRQAFSLMELLAVVTILGILAAIIVPRVTAGSETAKERSCVYNVGHIHSAVERYRDATGVWPSADLNELDGNLDYFPEGIPVCPVSGNAYRIDPTGERYRVIGHTDGAHTP
ncbi:Type II secretion system protein G precursor [Planctomycetes bacterium MalM25]|nr:Type II secretion system protein G precursor [Planctomycetes bacterium MalM25]